MSGVCIVLFALCTVMVASELFLRGSKLQTGLSRVLVVWAVVWGAAVYPALRYGDIGPLVFTIFWGGAFLSWFGVRSHIESSILLRMLYFLRGEPMGEPQLLHKYASHYGESMRAQELLRGGMTIKSGERTSVTPKGKAILRVVAKLR
jgi:hypothetical protein